MNAPAVWAPSARRVRLAVAAATENENEGDRHGRVAADVELVDLAAGDDGWWRSDRPLAAGTRYGFVLDDDDRPLPDPRSRHQPEGVHELSAIVDAGAFAWTDGGWTGRQLAGSVVYELHVGTFTPVGTLDSAIERLDHLVALGVDLVELLPVAAFDGTHSWGYDGVAWFAVAQTYGGPAAYRHFVDACHARGLGVVQDVVYNHLGPSGNYLPRFGPYLHADATNPWGAAIDLEVPDVRRFVVDNARMWFTEYHVDGLRLDAVHALNDTTSTHILRELAEETDAWSAALRRPLTLIAESDRNDPALVSPREAGGLGIHAQWSDDFHHAVHVALTGETDGYYADFAPRAALVKVLTHGFFHDGTYSSFRGRAHGRPLDIRTTPAWRLVVASQTHDQVGNRATGDRLAATLAEGQLAIAAVLTLAGPCTPMLFMGEEWGAGTPWQFFSSFTDPALAEATATGRVGEFARMGWDPSQVPDPQDPATFQASKLDWDEPTGGGHARLLDLYRRLIRLRRGRPDLTDWRLARTSCELGADGAWLVVRRGTTAVVVNFSATRVELAVPGASLLATDPATTVDGSGAVLAGHSAAIVDLAP